jgi:branched-chain amino acid transport system ATP-binding protein
MADAVLRVESVTKRFGALTANENVSLSLKSGEIHALIGPNGAGKSTLIKQIAGELRADAGSIWFDGSDVTASSEVTRARLGLARTFQITSVAMEFSVLQNVLLGRIGQDHSTFRLLKRAVGDQTLEAPAREAISRAGLGGREDMAAGDLSHGERRRLEIAMALVQKPKAFVLDEPMAGLGADGSQDLVGLLAELKADAPILLVEHDMDAVFRLADRISVLVYGRLIATGPPAEIRANPAVRKAYLGDAA